MVNTSGEFSSSNHIENQPSPHDTLYNNERKQWSDALGTQIDIQPLPRSVTPEVRKNLESLGLQLVYIPKIDLKLDELRGTTYTVNEKGGFNVPNISTEEYLKMLQGMYPKWKAYESLSASELKDPQIMRNVQQAFWELVRKGLVPDQQAVLNGHWLAVENSPDVIKTIEQDETTPLASRLGINEGDLPDWLTHDDVMESIEEYQQNALTGLGLPTSAKIRPLEILEQNLLIGRADIHRTECGVVHNTILAPGTKRYPHTVMDLGPDGEEIGDYDRYIPAKYVITSSPSSPVKVAYNRNSLAYPVGHFRAYETDIPGRLYEDGIHMRLGIALDNDGPIQDIKPIESNRYEIQSDKRANEESNTQTSLLTLNNDFGSSDDDTDYSSYETLDPSDIQEIGNSIVSLINLAVDRKLDSIFFLDKSARPVGHLFLKLWHEVFPDIRSPQVKYINVGRSNKLEIANGGNLGEELRHRYGNLEGQRVGVVDDFARSGESILRARDIVRSSFPNIESDTYTYFYSGSPTLNNGVGPGWSGEELLGVHESEQSNKHLLVEPGASNDFKEDIYRDFEDKHRQFRDELSRLAKDIATHITKQPIGSFAVNPNIPNLPKLQQAGLVE